MDILTLPIPGQQQPRESRRPPSLTSGIALFAAQATVACVAAAILLLPTLAGVGVGHPTELRLLSVVVLGLPLLVLVAHVVGLVLLWHRRRASRALALLTGALTTALAAVVVNDSTPLMSVVPAAIGVGGFILILRPSARRWYAARSSVP